MEKIIYLELDEEITSIIERIKKVKEKNIGIVVPRDALLLQSLVNLKLLSKQTSRLKKQISLVCPDRSGRRLAELAGFKVADSIELLKKEDQVAAADIPKEPVEPKAVEEEKGLEKIPTQTKPIVEAEKPKDFRPSEIKPEKLAPSIPEKPSKRIKINKKLLIFGGIFTLFVIAFIAFLFLPKAKVNIVIKSEEFSNSFQATADKNKVNLDIEKKIIPAQVNEAEIEVSKTASATGEKEIGEKAKGQMTIYNLYDSDAQKLASGTKLVRNGKVFLTTGSVTVPGVTKQAGQDVAGTAAVSLEAQKEGAEYNVSAGKFSVSGFPQSTFYGISTKAMAGGYSKTITVVSQQDSQNAKSSLAEEANKKAKDELAKKLNQDSEMLDDSIATEILVYSTDPGVDNEASEFKANLKVKAESLIYKKADLKQLAEANFRKAIEEKNRELVVIDTEKLAKNVTKLDLTKGRMTLTISGKAQSAPKIDQEKLKTNLVGKTSMEAEDYLSGFAEIESAEVELWPFWVKKVPSFKDNLKINIEYTTAPKTNE